MVGYKEDANVMCPYYLGERDIQLKCHGIVGQITTSFFVSKKDKEYYKDNFCSCMGYQGCPLAQMLQEIEV